MAFNQMLQDTLTLRVRKAELSAGQLHNAGYICGVHGDGRSLPHHAHHLSEPRFLCGGTDSVLHLQQKSVIVCSQRLFGLELEVLLRIRCPANMVALCGGVVDHHTVAAYQSVDQRLDVDRA